MAPAFDLCFQKALKPPKFSSTASAPSLRLCFQGWSEATHHMFRFLFSYSLIFPWGLLEFLMIKYIILVGEIRLSSPWREKTELIAYWAVCHMDQLYQQQPILGSGGQSLERTLSQVFPHWCWKDYHWIIPLCNALFAPGLFFFFFFLILCKYFFEW